MKLEIHLADICSLKGRLPMTDGKVAAMSRIAGFCTLRKMYVPEERINKETCKERAVIRV